MRGSVPRNACNAALCHAIHAMWLCATAIHAMRLCATAIHAMRGSVPRNPCNAALCHTIHAVRLCAMQSMQCGSVPLQSMQCAALCHAIHAMRGSVPRNPCNANSNQALTIQMSCLVCALQLRVQPESGFASCLILLGGHRPPSVNGNPARMKRKMTQNERFLTLLRSTVLERSAATGHSRHS